MAIATSTLRSQETLVPGRPDAVSNMVGGIYLTFMLGNEEFGIQIHKVHEIIGVAPITRIPRTPSHVCGVINLRGRVIPVMDLRLKFGMEIHERTGETCIIVAQIGAAPIGIVVDKVCEVLDVSDQDVEETPTFGIELNTDFILGIGKTAGRVRILLDIERVLSSDLA